MKFTNKYTTITLSRFHSILCPNVPSVQKWPNFYFQLLPDIRLSRCIARNLAHMFLEINSICVQFFMVIDGVVRGISLVNHKWCVFPRPVWNLHLGHFLRYRFGNPRYLLIQSSVTPQNWHTGSQQDREQPDTIKSAIRALQVAWETRKVWRDVFPRT